MSGPRWTGDKPLFVTRYHQRTYEFEEDGTAVLVEVVDEVFDPPLVIQPEPRR